MALRVRKDGRVVCAVQYEAQEGDVYIDDATHYSLARHFEKMLITREDFEWSDVYEKFLAGDEQAIPTWRATHPELTE